MPGRIILARREDSEHAQEAMLLPIYVLVCEFGDSGDMVKTPYSKDPYSVVHAVRVRSPMKTLSKAYKERGITPETQHSREELMEVFSYPYVLADMCEAPPHASCCSVM